MNIDLLSAFLTPVFALFSLFVAGVIIVLRKILEYYKPIKDNRWYNEVFLPIFPIILGGVLGYIFIGFPFPDGLITKSARVVFGAVAGEFSSLVFRLLKTVFGEKIIDLMSKFGGKSIEEINGEREDHCHHEDCHKEHHDEHMEHVEELKPVDRKEEHKD
jgi:uncharacterized protein (UPF0305 family)